MVIGIDFGTSNSTVGLSDEDGTRLITLEDEQVTLPSAVFYDLEDRIIRYGRDAVSAYTAAHDGRLMRALKSVLGSSLIDETTQVGDRRIAFTSIIGQFVGHLKHQAEQESGQPISSVVLGRPVHYVDGDEAADRRAQSRMEEIARTQGFDEIEFQYEPVAAALSYEAGLATEELVLVCDIGGGTSDFSLIRVGPARAGKIDRAQDILANTGVHVGGTDLDFRLSLYQVMPLLGMGSRLHLSTGGETALPLRPYHDLATWHRIVFLYNQKCLDTLGDIRRSAVSPHLVDRLIGIVEKRQGHLLAAIVEDAKIDLSGQDRAGIDLSFVEPDLAAIADIGRFQQDIASELRAMVGAIDQCVRLAGIAPAEIDAVFLTGGSTMMPVIHRACVAAAPHARIVEGDRFGSVGLGLALDAAARFGA